MPSPEFLHILKRQPPEPTRGGAEFEGKGIEQRALLGSGNVPKANSATRKGWMQSWSF
jgi:hypothetical protein